MSWIGGDFVIPNNTDDTLEKAIASIRAAVRSNANLYEFPNMGNEIRIKSLTHYPCASREAAEQYAEEHGEEWHRNYNVYVPFYDVDSLKPSKAEVTAEAKLVATKKKMADYQSAHTVSNFKATLVTCPQCTSRINKQYIRYDKCPLCRNDLRSETVKKTVNKYLSDIKALEDKLQKMKESRKGKAPVKYLVCYEEYIG